MHNMTKKNTFQQLKRHVAQGGKHMAIAAVCSMLVHGAWADGHHDHHDHHEHKGHAHHGKHEQHAHEHGVATLNIAASGDEVLVELDSPADNIVGFEHQPHTDKQKFAVKNALAKLNKPTEHMLSFSSAAGCTLHEADVDSPFKMDEEMDHDDHDKKDAKHDHKEHAHEHEKHDEHDAHEDHEHHAHAEHDHHDKHEEHEKHAHHDEHDHDAHEHKGHDHDEHEHGDENVHSDFEVEYEFECKNVKAIKQVDLSNMFSHFPNFQTVKVNWVTSSGQSAARATAKSPVISLK